MRVYVDTDELWPYFRFTPERAAFNWGTPIEVPDELMEELWEARKRASAIEDQILELLVAQAPDSPEARRV